MKKRLNDRNFWYTAVFLIFSFFLVFLGKNLAQAAEVPNIITYQGKLLVNGSAATTTQAIKFVLYDALSSGTALYTASGTLPTTSTVSVTVSNGFFTVNLGDTGTNSLDPSIFKDNSNVYLEVTVGGETLTPRKRLTAASFAFNSKYLNGVSATATPQSSVYIPMSDSGGNFNFNSATFTRVTTTVSFWSQLMTAVTGAFSDLTWTNGTSTGNTALNVLTTTGTTTLATTTISSSSVGYLNVLNNISIGGLLSVTGNSSFGTIASGTWNGNAVSATYGGTGQNSSGWSGFVKVTGGTWATSSIASSDLSDSASLAFLSGSQTFTGAKIFSATSTFATTTISSSTIGYLNVTNNTNIDGTLSVTGNSSFGTIASGTWNGNAISSVYGGTGQNSSGWSGIAVISGGVWSASSTLSLAFGGTGTSTFANGGIVFSDGNKLTQDISNFYWDNTNKRLGLGTSTPSEKLHVYGGTLLVDNPINPTIVGSVVSSTDLASPSAIDVVGKYGYVVGSLGGDHWLTVLDFSIPSAPAIIGTFRNYNYLTSPDEIKVSGRYAYITSGVSSTLTIVDISNPRTMNVVGYITGVPASSALAINGGYAYVAGTNYFSVIDISNPALPTLESSLNNGVFSQTKEIFIKGRYAYVAVDGGIAIVDISNPNSITLKGTGTLANYSQSIDISGQYAYTLNGGGIIINELKIWNISNPDVTPINPVGSSTNSNISSGQLKKVRVAGKYAYAVGASYFLVYDVSDKTAPRVIKELADGSFNGSAGFFLDGKYAYVLSSNSDSIKVIDLEGADISSATIGSVGTDRLTVWQDASIGNNLRVSNSINVGFGGIFSNGSLSITVSSTNILDNLLNVGTNSSSSILTVRGDGSVVLVTSSAFLVNSNGNVGIGTSTPQQKLHIYDGTLLVDSPVNPTLAGSATFVASPGVNSVQVSGKYGYVLTNVGLATVNIDDKTNPVPVGYLTIGGIINVREKSLMVAGKYAYITASASNTLNIVDISNPKSPTLVYAFSDNSLLTSANSVFVSGKYAYIVASGTSTVSIVDVSNPNNPRVVGHVTDATKFNDARGIYQSGRYLYVAGRSNNYLTVIDVASPSSPVIVGSVTNGTSLNGATSVYVSGNYAYVSSFFSNSVAIVDISDPTAPAVTGYLIDNVNLDDARSIFVSGKYAYVAAYGANKLAIVDISNATAPRLVGTYSNSTYTQGANGVFVSGKYAYIASITSQKLTIIDLKGADISSADIGNVSSNNLTVWESLEVGNNLNVRSSLNVGGGGLMLNGDFAMSGITTNTLNFSTTTVFSSSIPSSSVNAFIFDAINTPTSSSQYLLSVRAAGTPVFSVSSNGNVHALGTLNASSATVGTPGTPGDLAERVDISLDDSVEPGDVVVVDPDSIDTYRRSSGIYSETVAGVISTNPTIVVGNGKTENTAVMAMVGRVPIKVSNENGPIKKGDLLVSASLPGYAMRYDISKDETYKTVSVVGLALEDMLLNETGKVMGLVKTGWINNSAYTLSVMKTDLQKLATAQGVSLGSNQNLNVQNVNGNLAYSGGDLNLQGNQLLNVASIKGKNNKWLIDEQGRFITRVNTSQGDKDMYAIQSPNYEFVFSSSSQMISGEAKILFDSYVQEVIDQQMPIKINITLTSGEAKGIYVSEKSAQGFTVKELDNGQSNATFDWMVVATRKPEDQQSSPTFELDNGQSNNVENISDPALINNSTSSNNTSSSEPAVSSGAETLLEAPLNSGSVSPASSEVVPETVPTTQTTVSAQSPGVSVSEPAPVVEQTAPVSTPVSAESAPSAPDAAPATPTIAP